MQIQIFSTLVLKELNCLKLKDTPPRFVPFFTKDNNFRDFLYASLEEKSPLNTGCTPKRKNLLPKGKLFPVRVDLH